MNTIRPTRLVTALLPLLALPMLVQADARPDPQMDACIQAFVASNVEKERPVSIRKFTAFENTLDLHARQQTIYLTARFKESGKKVAQATCLVNGDDVVLTVQGKPTLTTKLAQAQTVQSAR